MKLLFVCLGNICRSPTAEGIAKHLARQNGLSMEIASAGTIAYHQGNPPDPRSQAETKKHGINISMQKSRLLSVKDLNYYDYIIAMDKQNLADIQAIKPKSCFAKIRLLHHATKEDVIDPYYLAEDGFAKTYQSIERGIKALLDELV